MTVEEIERILQSVAENQANLTSAAARTDERLNQVAENQNRHSEHMAEMERMHSRHSADVAEIDAGFAMLLKSQNRFDERLALISDIMHDLADKHLKNEERFAELAAARVGNEARLDKMEASYELLEAFVRDFRNETNNRLVQTDERFAETDKRLAALAEAQAKTDEQMKRTDDRINALLDRNGAKPKRRASKRSPPKKATKTTRRGRKQ